MKFVCYFFDILANKILNTCHSRDIFKRRFVVYDNIAVGMTIRDKYSFDLLESIESRQMVLNLSSFQNYLKYTWFLIFTANHSKHPGLAHLHEWKVINRRWCNNY